MLPMFSRSTSLALCLFATAMAGWAQQATLEIVEAVYGAGNFQMNVTQLVRGMVRNNTLDVAADPAVLGGDPAPGQGKRLRVIYRLNGRQMEASAGDFERVRLPVPVAAAPTTTTPQQQQQQGGNWAAGAVPNATQPAAPASPGGFSIGDILGNPAPAGAASPAPAALRIVAARYGAETRFHDVRERLQAMVRGETLSTKVDNAAMGGDPAVAKSKTLEVTYEYRGATYQLAAKEGATLNLPDASARVVSSAPAAPLPAAASLRIVAARYGSGDRFNDVRDRLQGLVRDGALSVKVDNAAMGGDPAVAKDKSLEVTYELNGATYRTAVREGRTLNLPDSAAQVVSTPAAVTAPVAAAPSASPQTRGADTGASRSAGNRNVAAPVASSGSVAPLGTAGGLRIFYARYTAADGREADIRERLRPLLQNDSLRVTVGAEAFGDPAPGASKVATIIYEYKGRTYEKSGRDGEVIQLP